ncbi:HET domain-containing protein [Fusarium keratoplasticum]|nr:HET domain-containing protein [Fusarium keratoplasticum]
MPQEPDQPDTPADFCDSPRDLSPESDHPNTMATYIPPQNSTSLKRKFETVEAAAPTPALKKVTTFTDGSYGKEAEPKTSKVKKFMNEAIRKYNYDGCPLPDGHIRLLVLKSSENRNYPIIVQLVPVAVADIVAKPEDYQFTALSYNWGGGKEENEIFVDTAPPNSETSETMKGWEDLFPALKRYLRPICVKPNLHAFLKEFRQPKKSVTLWVDRVCINQANTSEKADQVSKMGVIYSTAANVAIWLGTPDNEGKSDRAMDFIGSMLKQDVEQKLRDENAQNQDAMQWSDLLSLMRRRWFSRRWIIQELALAKNAEVRCGSKRVHWRDFSDAVSIFELHFDIILKIIKRRPDLEQSLEGIKDMKPFGARILVDVLSNTFQRDANGTIYSPRQGLESLISSLSTFETSDPRDTIYTLLNLAKETFDLPSEDVVRKEKRQKRNEANPPPEPDYSMNLLDVYTKFMKWCIEESKSLDILCRHWALPEVDTKPDKFYPELVELPSWITTVRKSAYGSQQEGFGGRKTGDSFVGTPESRCYNASLNLPPDIQWGRDQGVSPTKSPNTGLPRTATSRRLPLPSGKTVPRRPRPQQGLSRVLTIKGFYLGQVSERHQMPEGIITKEVLETLGHDSTPNRLERVPDALWRTLVADRGPDGKAPPAWYHRACMTCLVSDTSVGNIDTNQILQQKDTTKMQADYLKRVQAVCWNRTFIECGDGDDGNKLFGIAPLDVRPNDLVCILYGCSVPCILRQTLYGSGSDSKEGSSDERGSKDPSYFYQLIGEAFILGQMDGEAIMDLSEEDLRSASDDFHLV